MLWTLLELERVKTYNSNRPINSAAISSARPHIVMAGGQDARDAALTKAHLGRFETQMYHSIFEELMGEVKGHFGPVHSVAFYPDGAGFITGGEDGTVRMQTFGPEYFDLAFEGERLAPRR